MEVPTKAAPISMMVTPVIKGLNAALNTFAGMKEAITSIQQVTMAVPSILHGEKRIEQQSGCESA